MTSPKIDKDDNRNDAEVIDRQSFSAVNYSQNTWHDGPPVFFPIIFRLPTVKWWSAWSSP